MILFALIPLFLVTIDAEFLNTPKNQLTDALRLKCDTLPYRTIFVGTRCYFAVMKEVSYSEAPGQCSSILDGATMATDVPAGIFKTLMVDASKYHVGKCDGTKHIICYRDSVYECADSQQSSLMPGQCFNFSNTKISYNKLPEIVSMSLGVFRGQKKLKSTVHGTYLRSNGSEWRAFMAKGEENWIIEEMNGKVVLKTIYKYDQFLRVNYHGWVDLVDKLNVSEKGEDTWKPLRNEDGSWSLQSTRGGWLSARADGSLTIVEQRDAWERFWLESWTDCSRTSRSTIKGNMTASVPVDLGGPRSLKSAHGKWLRGTSPTSQWVDSVAWCADWEHWIVENWDDGKISLRYIYQPTRWLRSNANGGVEMVQWRDIHEYWKPVKNADGTWSLQGYHGFYISFNPNGVVGQVAWCGIWEKFTFGRW